MRAEASDSDCIWVRVNNFPHTLNLQQTTLITNAKTKKGEISTGETAIMQIEIKQSGNGRNDQL